jgi:peptidyl-dipeptidase Dcp
VASVFFNLAGSTSSEDIRAIERDISPLWSRHFSGIYLNQDLFARIDAVYEGRADVGLTAEQLRLLERVHLDFVRAGAKLDDAGRARLAAIDEEVSGLATQFDQNLLADTAAWTLTLNGEADMAGLPQTLRAGALAAGADLEREGEYVITLQR